jgi:hypothetical protein
MPLKFTAEPLTKLNPSTVNVNPAPPATTLEGLMSETMGTGEVLEADVGGT